MTESVVLSWERNGRGKPIIKAVRGGETLLLERCDLADSKARVKLGARLHQVAGIAPAEAQRQLLAFADEAMRPEPAPAAPDFGALPEVDVSSIIRPERFITPEVCGLAVPTMTTLGEKVAGRWVVYLNWADGKRERRPLASTLDLPEGRRLWVHPEPSEPSPSTRPGWSPAARRRWLEGAPAPGPAELFKALAERFAYFIDLPREHAPGITATVVCWSMLSYVYCAFPAVPYLYVGGPLGSGKSRLFEILARLVFRPLTSSNMTAPTMFRSLHDRGGVLLLDEAERLRNTQDPATGEILSMLLAGYKKGGQALRLEPVGDSGFKTVAFDVYGAKALACVAGLPPALASRCIPIVMFRAAPGSEKPRRRIDGDPAGWQRLRDQLHAMALEHGRAWLDLPARTDVCPEMSGRDYELWQPILAIASFIEEAGAQGLLRLLQEHALAVIDRGKDDSTPEADEALLRLLAEAVRLGERPTPHDLLARATEAEPVVFKNWHPRTVTARLKTYGIPTPRKVGSRREFRDVTPEVLRRIQASYGIDLDFPEDTTPEESSQPSQPSQPSQQSQDSLFPEEK